MVPKKKNCSFCKRKSFYELNVQSKESIIKFYFCKQHASDRSFSLSLHIPDEIEDTFKNLVEDVVRKEIEKRDDTSCEGCGTTLLDFFETGFLGCVDCHETFAEQLKEILKKVQSTSTEISIPSEDMVDNFESIYERIRELEEEAKKVDKDLADVEEKINKSNKKVEDLKNIEEVLSKIFELDSKLEKCVENEEFLQAAEIRDKIKKLEEECNGLDNIFLR